MFLPTPSTSFSALLFLIFVAKHCTLSFQPRDSAASTRTNLKMTSKITEVRTDDAPDPLGPYSQAVLAGNTLYCSGNIAIDPKTGEIVGDGDVQEETRQVLKNMDAVLKKGGASAENVVRCTVFLDDLQNFVSFLRCRIKRERFFSFAMSVFAHPSSSITYYLYLLSGCRQ